MPNKLFKKYSISDIRVRKAIYSFGIDAVRHSRKPIKKIMWGKSGDKRKLAKIRNKTKVDWSVK